MMKSSPEIYLPQMNVAYDYSIWDEKKIKATQSKGQRIRIFEHLYRMSALSNISNVVMIDEDSTDEMNFSKDPTEWTRHFIQRSSAKDMMPYCVGGGLSTNALSLSSSASAPTSSTTSVIDGMERALCELQTEANRKKVSHIAIKSGKLAFAIPAVCEAMRRLGLGKDYRGNDAGSSSSNSSNPKESTSHPSVRFVMYVRNGLDMAFSTNRRQLRLALSLRLLDFRALSAKLSKSVKSKEWSHLMRLIGYDTITETFRKLRSERARALQGDITTYILQGAYWAALYTQAESCASFCVDSTSTRLIRFEDFVGVSTSKREREIGAIFEWLRIETTSAQKKKMREVFMTAIGKSHEAAEFDANEHLGKFERVAGGRITAAALLCIPAFRQTMRRFGYRIPSVDAFLLSGI